jgi:hypothetical protein
LGINWRALELKMSVNFMATWEILQLIDIFRGRCVYFSLFWYVVPRKIWQPCRATEFVSCDTNRSLSIRVVRPNFVSSDQFLCHTTKFCVVQHNSCRPAKFRVIRPIFMSHDKVLRRATQFVSSGQISCHQTNFYVTRQSFVSYDTKFMFRINMPYINTLEVGRARGQRPKAN